jgi:ribonuclease R
MGDDYYRFVEEAHTLRGENTKKVYRLGDRVQVQIVRVDLGRRQIDLGLVDVLENVRSSARPRGPVRSRVAPKAERRRTNRPGRRERKAGKAGRGRKGG